MSDIAKPWSIDAPVHDCCLCVDLQRSELHTHQLPLIPSPWPIFESELSQHGLGFNQDNQVFKGYSWHKLQY